MHINFILIHLSLFLSQDTCIQPYEYRYFLWQIILFPISMCVPAWCFATERNYKLLLWRQNHKIAAYSIKISKKWRKTFQMLHTFNCYNRVAVHQRGTTTTSAFPHQTVVDSPKCGSQNTWRLQAKTLHLSVATSIAKCRHWRRCHWQVLSFFACPTATRVHHNWNFENGLLVDNNNFYRHCFHDV